MIKKLWLTGMLALAVSGTVYADGFYAGLGMGIGGLSEKLNTNIPSQSNAISNTSYMGGGMAGYDFNFSNQMNLGLEIFLTGSAAKAVVNSSNATSLSIKSAFNYGLRVLPGYKFAPNTIGYLILGVSQNNFKLSDNGVYGIVNDSFYKMGYQVGLGGTTNLWDQNWFVRADVIYSGYGNHSSNGATTRGVPNVYRSSLNTLEGMLSLVYHFS